MTKNIIRISFIISLLIIIISCATTVKYKIEHPPEICLGMIKSIKINRFTVSGNLNLSYRNHGRIIGKFVEFAETTINKKEGNRNIKNYYYSDLMNKFADNGFYAIVEGNVPYGVKINGDIFYNVQDNYHTRIEEQKKKDKKGKEITIKKKIFTLKRDADIIVHIRVIDKNGKVVGASKVSANSSDRVVENSLGSALHNIETWESLVYDALDNTTTPVLHKVVPYYTYEHLALKDGDSKRIKIANKKAKKGNWKGAVKIWESCEASGNNKEKIAAMYNLAIYNEVHDNLEIALEKFKKLNELTQDSSYDVDINRIKQRMLEEKKLEKEPKLKE